MTELDECLSVDGDIATRDESRSLQAKDEIIRKFVILAHETEGDCGDGVIAPGIVERAEEVFALVGLEDFAEIIKFAVSSEDDIEGLDHKAEEGDVLVSVEYFSECDEYLGGLDLEAHPSDDEDGNGVEVNSPLVELVDDFFTNSFEELATDFRDEVEQEHHLIYKLE